MYKWIRALIALSLVAGVLFLARDKVAWAEPVVEAKLAEQPQEGDAAPLAFDGEEARKGTVKPPRPWLWICDEGVYSVGGVVSLSVEDLAPDYCIRAHLWKAQWPPAHAPAGTGQILAPITFIRVFYKGRFIKHLPLEDGQVELCYAVPPGKQAKIYFLDVYKGKGKPGWTPLPTTMKDGLACAPAQDSGAYALIGN